MNRKVRKIQAKIRKMSWVEKLMLMDWLNAWYSDIKEQQRMEEE
jgi:hypothetical protein